jgi:hypothetical protein
MKKKKLTKKLKLNIEKISNLNHQEMKETKGMSAIFVCTESCSALFVCCDPKTNPIEENREREKDQG